MNPNAVRMIVPKIFVSDTPCAAHLPSSRQVEVFCMDYDCKFNSRFFNDYSFDRFRRIAFLTMPDTCIETESSDA